MNLVIPPRELIPFGMRALKMIALANGEFAERERALLEAAQKTFHVEIDLDSLEPITPEELAAAVEPPALRKQLLYGMLMLSLADGEASTEEADLVEKFRDALGVDAHEVKTFRNLSEGHLMMARFDVLRRFWAREHIVKKAKEEGFGWLAKMVAAIANIAEDKKLKEKYRALDDYPEGTFGRAYANFINENGFSMPGEKGSPPEPIVIHDLTHVLSGYGTDPASEICVTAFHAGYRTDEPFTWILFSMMQFNLGVRLTPVAEASTLNFDPPRVLEALKRGSQMNADLTDTTWDYWADMLLPLDEVRAKYNILPLEAS